jgi:hypothetical protein
MNIIKYSTKKRKTFIGELDKNLMIKDTDNNDIMHHEIQKQATRTFLEKSSLFQEINEEAIEIENNQHEHDDDSKDTSYDVIPKPPNKHKSSIHLFKADFKLNQSDYSNESNNPYKIIRKRTTDNIVMGFGHDHKIILDEENKNEEINLDINQITNPSVADSSDLGTIRIQTESHYRKYKNI